MATPEESGPVATARELHVEGVLRLRQGRPRAAADRLGESLAILRSADGPAAAGLRARVLISLGYVDFELRGFDAAMARLDEAVAYVEAHQRWEAVAALRVQRALVLLHVGRYGDALGEFDVGAASLEHASASDRIALLQNRAVVHIATGDLASARTDLEASLVELRAAGLPVVLTLKSTHNLGFVEFLSGNLTRALELMNSAEQMDPDVDPGASLLSKAQVLVEAGLLREADEALATAAEMFARDRMYSYLPETELERARCALARGDRTRARALAGSAARRYRRAANDAGRRGAEIVLLQAELAAGDRAAARRVVPRARRLAEELGDVRLPARIATLIHAEALLTADRVEDAADTVRRVGVVRADDPITGRMYARYVRASVEAAQGRRTRASSVIRRALDELARYQASFGSIDLRTASAVHGRRLAELDVRLALGSGRAASVFAALERARAVSNRLPPVQAPDDPEAAALLGELRGLVDSLRPVEQDPVASAPLLRRRRELERLITARTWQRRGQGVVDGASTLTDVRAALAGAGSTMLAYLQADGRLWALRVGADVRMTSLGPADAVEELVRRVRADLDVLAQSRLPGPIHGVVRASLHRSLAALDSALLAAVGTVDGPLVVVSTGVLGQVPWASLPSLRGVPVVVAPSATTWSAAQSAPAAPATTMSAIAGPGLGFAGTEAEAVAGCWADGRCVRGSDATSAVFTAAMASSTVVHVAAHGVHQPENPLFSSVRMVDGPVFAHELDRHASTPEHVVLSACEVGLATIRPGDEALGLASVLLRLGTTSVIAGVARVNDEAAQRTMVDYHRRLAGGADSATALAGALVEVDADVVPPFVNLGAAWRSAPRSAPRAASGAASGGTR